ncbi:MAG: HIT family protein [Anaerolineales bacterium]|nr:HIT family protein [Anaerolineales bacterium]
MDRDPECVFCNIVHGDGEAHIIYKDERVTAFLDIHPVNPGHTLVIPNVHAASIQDIPDDICGWMFVIGRDIDAGLRQSGLRSEAVNLYLADGRAAGQVVFHAHLHVIPRFPGDPSGLKLPAGPPGSPSPAELAEHARMLGSAFRAVRKSES